VLSLAGAVPVGADEAGVFDSLVGIMNRRTTLSEEIFGVQATD